MADGNSVLGGRGEEITGHRNLDGTDLEIVYNLSGDGLVLRVNKGPCQVFRVCLRGARKPVLERDLLSFNSVSSDYMFENGGLRNACLGARRRA